MLSPIPKAVLLAQCQGARQELLRPKQKGTCGKGNDKGKGNFDIKVDDIDNSKADHKGKGNSDIGKAGHKGKGNSVIDGKAKSKPKDINSNANGQKGDDEGHATT